MPPQCWGSILQRPHLLMQRNVPFFFSFLNFNRQGLLTKVQWSCLSVRFHFHLLSVGVPFRGDHIGLRRNPLWKEVLAKNSLQRMDRFVVFADIVNKINRSNGKARGFCVRKMFVQLTRNLITNQTKVWLIGSELMLIEGRCLTWLLTFASSSCNSLLLTDSFSVDNY